MNAENDMSVVIEFLYLSKERYGFSPENAAEEVFSNLERNKAAPSCVDAIRSCLKRETILERQSSIWNEQEIRNYLEKFMTQYDKIRSKKGD